VTIKVSTTEICGVTSIQVWGNAAIFIVPPLEKFGEKFMFLIWTKIFL